MWKKDDVCERMLRDVVSQAIEKGKLFELIFTEEGRRLWGPQYSEEKFRKMVREELKNMK